MPRAPGWEDDLAFENGVGFTDIVKRPTQEASEVRPDEFEHRRELLRTKIEAARPQLAIFTFKKTAEALFGPLSGHGLVPGLEFGGAPTFVMPATVCTPPRG